MKFRQEDQTGFRERWEIEVPQKIPVIFPPRLTPVLYLTEQVSVQLDEYTKRKVGLI